MNILCFTHTVLIIFRITDFVIFSIGSVC